MNFVYSGGLWQHEIGIEKVFWGISKLNFSASSQWRKICFGYQGIIFSGKKVVKVFSKYLQRNFTFPYFYWQLESKRCYIAHRKSWSLKFKIWGHFSIQITHQSLVLQTSFLESFFRNVHSQWAQKVPFPHLNKGKVRQKIICSKFL